VAEPALPPQPSPACPRCLATDLATDRIANGGPLSASVP